jgi:hypothetical protein
VWPGTDPICELVHHRIWLTGNSRSAPAVRTAQVAAESARLDALEAAARPLVEPAQARVVGGATIFTPNGSTGDDGLAEFGVSDGYSGASQQR